jgi:hypothetical protein
MEMVSPEEKRASTLRWASLGLRLTDGVTYLA